MTWSEKFFTQRRLTSKLKHLVLRRYVKEFAYHLGSVRPIVYYVDGFAGAGTYELGSMREDGSPLLIARLAEEIRNSRRPFDLRCLNVESNTARFRNLETATERFRPQIVEQNFHASFVDVVPQILLHVGASPSFFFIDPFGTKGIAFRNLEPIFQRRWTTEVFITFHTDGIAKKAGWFRYEDSSNPDERKNARSLLNHLATALNISLDRLRDGWRETAARGDTTAFEERAVRYYLNQLRSNRTRFKFVKPFRVFYYDADEPLKRTPVCFHLVFATQHEKGLFEMNDAMTDAVRAFYQESYASHLFPTLVSEYDQQAGRVALQSDIRTHFASKRAFTINDVKRRGMQTDFLLKGSEYRTLVVHMARAELEKLDPGSVSNAKTRFRFKAQPF